MLSFFVHFIVASPYAFIGVPNDVVMVVATEWYIVYDGFLMAWDQSRLAQRDMSLRGVEVREARSFLDWLIPAPLPLNIDTTEGRLNEMARVVDRTNAGGLYGLTWKKNVDTVVVFHQTSKKDIQSLAAYLKHRPARAGERNIEHLIVPSNNDPTLKAELAKMQGPNVTVLDHSFDPTGELVIDRHHFLSWSRDKGSIAWVTLRSLNAVPVKAD